MERKSYPLITFCGMDGTGKTTLAKEVADFLEKQGANFKFIHGHGYSVSNNSFGIRDNWVRKLRFIFKLLLPFALIDNLITYYFKYKPILRTKALVCDRYFYDKLARMMYYGICGKHAARVYLKLLPKPGYVFFLDIDAISAHSRKGEYSTEQYNIFREAYLFIASYLGAPVIDTSLPVDICRQRIIEKINLGAIRK